MSDFDFAALERRVAALEDGHPASLRFGTVVGNDNGRVRVRLDDGQSTVSAPLPTLQRRVLHDQELKLPDLGEPVAVLFSGQGREAGVVLGAYYSRSLPPPDEAPHQAYARFKDGTEWRYDRETHTLTLHVLGDVDISATGDIRIWAGGTLKFNAAHISAQE